MPCALRVRRAYSDWEQDAMELAMCFVTEKSEQRVTPKHLSSSTLMIESGEGGIDIRLSLERGR